MVSRIFAFPAQSSLLCVSHSPKPIPSKFSPNQSTRPTFLDVHPSFSLGRSIPPPRLRQSKPSSVCFSNKSEDAQEKEGGLNWPVLKRWEAPWGWQVGTLTSLSCGLSFIVTGLVEATAIPYLGIDIEKLSLDERAELLFLDQSVVTAVILTILYTVANAYKPLPEDMYRYDLKEPLNLRNGWLLWAGIGLVGAFAAITFTGAAMTYFNGEPPERDADALVKLLPLIGSSSISTACLLGVTGVLAPILEENVFRGFFMVTLTKWVPTPIAIIVSAAVFALAHLTPGEFPQLFVLGTALGLSYAQTRNLLTPITIHAFWNSGVILLLTFLQLQGYDIKEMLQAS